MRRFKWIEWNLQKIAAHGLSAEEVEAAFDRVYQLDERRDGSFRMFAGAIWLPDLGDLAIRPGGRAGSGRVRRGRRGVSLRHHRLLTERLPPMPTPQPDLRSERRKALDEQLASEPHLPHPVIPPGEQPRPLEGHLRHRHPVAVVGVVEDGLVRLLDPRVRLPEQSRVIVVAAEPS